jgi:hypothetical protein
VWERKDSSPTLLITGQYDVLGINASMNCFSKKENVRPDEPLVASFQAFTTQVTAIVLAHIHGRYQRVL